MGGNMFRIGLLATFALAACAGQSQTTTHLAESMAAVRGAETAGAARIPQAALHLKLAQEEIKQAEDANDDTERSNSLALRAYNDADLALALTREADSRQQLASFSEAHPELVSAPATSQVSNPEMVKP
jgi:pyridoxal biosynthesis lyase PdxS